MILDQGMSLLIRNTIHIFRARGSTCIDNQLFKVKYAFNVETLIYVVRTYISQTTWIFGHLCKLNSSVLQGLTL